MKTGIFTFEAGSLRTGHDLFAFLSSRKRNGGFIISIADATLKRRWNLLADELSFHHKIPGDKLLIHDQRHIFAQTLRDSGAEMGDISSFLNQKSIRVTRERYARAGGYNGHEKISRCGAFLQIGTFLLDTTEG